MILYAYITVYVCMYVKIRRHQHTPQSERAQIYFAPTYHFSFLPQTKRKRPKQNTNKRVVCAPMCVLRLRQALGPLMRICYSERRGTVRST